MVYHKKTYPLEYPTVAEGAADLLARIIDEGSGWEDAPILFLSVISQCRSITVLSQNSDFISRNLQRVLQISGESEAGVAQKRESLKNFVSILRAVMKKRQEKLLLIC